MAVGSKIFFDSPEHPVNTFTDFLLNYVRQPLGSGWGQAELKKPRDQRHPIMQWYAHLCEVQKATAVREADGTYSMNTDGICSAYLHLAYDLYILDDHQKLQKEVLKRLRRVDSFVGARYELLVAASCIRAGCDIEYEDEHDPAKRHPEFVATHRETGCVFAVEAKGREQSASASPNASMRRRLFDAAGKEALRPYVVFVDVNLPPDDVQGPPSWGVDASSAVHEVIAAVGHCPFDLVVFTNFPHQYGEMGQADPPKHVFFWPGRAYRGDKLPQKIEMAIVTSVSQYDNIPADLPA